jgi:hypothetical protein
MSVAEDRDYLDNLLTERQAAVFLGHKVKTLQKWRITGEGPVYINFSRRSVRYRRRNLLAFIEAHSFTSTSEATVARGRGK